MFLEFRGRHPLQETITLTSEYYDVGFRQLKAVHKPEISFESAKMLNGYLK